MRPPPGRSKHSVNQVEIAVWDWPGDGPPILLCHATGFHARIWDQIVERLPGRHCIALDFRGHGESGKPAPPYRWRAFGEDLAQLAERLHLAGAIGVGHSMGGHSVTLAAALNPAAFARLVLLDPTIFPQDVYRGPFPPLDFVLKRRNEWDSADQMYERYRTRAPFETWDPTILRDYCDYALNGAALACPPEVEASIYSNSTGVESDIYAEIQSIRMPVRIVRSREPYSYGLFHGSPTDPGLATHFPNATDEHRTDVSHFIPMEAPDLTSKLILGA